MKNNTFKKWLTLSALFAFLCFSPHGLLRAQSSANYTFSTNTTGSLVDMSAGTTQLIGPNTDAVASAVTTIGFNYNFMGGTFTQFSVNDDGVLQLGATVVGTNVFSINTGSATSPKIAPFNADLRTGTVTGKVHYKLIGSAPNRQLVVEFKDMMLFYLNPGTTGTSTFQVVISETTGRIDFIYGTMSVTDITAGNRSPSIGFYIGAAANSFASVTYSSNTSTTTGTYTANPAVAATGAIASLTSAADGSRRVYSYAPIIPIAPTALSFTAVGATTMTLNWTDNASTELGYRVYRSLDGISYTLVNQLAANSTSYIANGLSVSTLYYWKVVVYGELGESTPDLLGTQSTTAPALAGGIKTVGSGGDYQNLTTAFTDINAQGLTGNIELQLITGYPAAPETYPIQSCIAGATGAFTVKVYPTVSGLSITSADVTGTLNLNGAANLTFDGRVNQTGASNLVISNTNAGTSYAVQFVNDAKTNTLQYLTIHSANTSTGSGTIVFAGSTGTTGNDNNVIDNCDIKDGATTPLNGIYSAGTSTTVDNSGNTVSNSNIYNYFGAATASNGVLLASNSSAWTINANKFYQTTTRTITAGSQHRGINIITASGNGYVITNNVIGYASSTATGVTTYTASAGRFFGIELTAANTGTASSIQGNTVTAISLTTTSGTTAAPGIFSGISVLSGTVSIGNIAPNIIGAATGTGAISITTSSSANIFGIHATSTGTLNVVNNVIGAINGTGSAAGISCGIVGVNTTGASTATTITGNTIGGATANSIVSGTSGLTTATQNVSGIATASGVTALTVTGNTINNITNYSSGTSSTLGGIISANAPTTAIVSNNTVSNSLLTAGALTGFGVANPGALTASGNMIFNASVTNASGAINGISSTSGTTMSFSKNKIYNLNASGTGSSVNGIVISGGTTVNINNNLIGDLRTPLTSATNPLNGINITGGTTINVYYNTVYLNGSSSGTNFGSSAVSVATGTTVDFRNNIFNNASVSNGTGLSVAYRRSSTTLTSYAATSNRNDLVAPVLFHDGTNSDLTLTAYQTRVGARDANSISQAPNYLSTAGSSVDFLHINASVPTLLESAGANVAGLTTDFDGNIRQGNPGYVGTGTAPDMGADEFELLITNCSTVSGGTISPASASICAGATRSMTVTGATNLGGITYQWQVSTTPGGPYTNVSGGSGATTDSYTTGAMTAGTYYFVMQTTCSFGPVSGLSSEFALTVNPTPVVVVNPSSGTYCSPGGTAVALAATGATTYAWTPATGLSATNVANVNASPSATTTYSVVGTALGCASAATPVTITVSPMPTLASVTATPAAVCDGSNSQLVANGNIPYNSGASAYTFAGSTGTYTPIVGTALPGAIGDDFAVGNLPIGFTFNYGGGTQTVFAVASNGFIELGSTLTYVDNGTSFWVPSTNALVNRANIIAPIWEDNNTTGATVSYATTGSAPNRVLTVQWTGMHTGSTGSTVNPTINCQVQLFETTGQIKFNYGSTSAALVGTTASIGLSTTVGNYLSVTPLAPASASTVSSSSENTGISSATNFPSGTVYTFTPPSVPVLTYAWSPSTYLSATNIANPVATAVTGPITYNVVATTGAGCTVNGNVSLTVKPIPTAPTATNSAQCGTQIPTASVTSTTGVPTPTFVWYDAPVGGTLLQSSTSSTFTSNVSVTTTFSVAELSATGCESNRIPVTVTVASADVISATINNATICLGASVNLNTANLNPTPVQSYAYSWSSTVGSGMETPVSGAAQTVTPTGVGTYTYTVTAVDGGCSAVNTVNLTVNQSAPANTAGVSDNSICNGEAVNLTSTVQSTATVLAQNFDAGLSGWTTTFNGTAPASTGFMIQNAPYTYDGTMDFTNFATPQGGGFMMSNADLGTSGNKTRTTVVSPVFSTAGLINATLTFQNLYQKFSSGDSLVRLEISMDGGSSWATLKDYLPLGNQGVTTNNAQVPANESIALTAPYLNQPNMKIRFNYVSAWGFMWLIDNVKISGTTDMTLAWTSAPAGFTSNVQNPVGVTPAVSTTYTITVTNGVGCTSTSSVAVTVNQPTSSSVSVASCYSYTWPQNGATYTTSGTHTATIPNAAGCDSVITLNLTINGTTTSSSSAVACDTYTWVQNGMTYVTSGAYHDTIPNAAGCDSVITLNLTINHSTTAMVNQSACQTYTWAQNGMTYLVSGMYNDTLTNAAGCDSIVTLNLTINQPNTGTDAQVACSSYTWNATTYNTSGTYTQILTNAAGCDSTVTLTLTINQPTASTVPVMECTSYTWAQNGMTYMTSGMYNDTIPNAAGCDSVITLNLTIIQPTTSSVSATACTSYTWVQNGMIYMASGAYHDTIPNMSGCDSIITLNLTINQPTSATVTVSTCNPSYVWAQTGMTYTVSGAYHDTITNAAGCDSVITLNLTIAPFVATATDNGNATATASAGTTYQWINCTTNSPIAGATAQTFVATANGTYAAIVSNGTCSDTTNCVTIANVGIKENMISTISVHPNPTHDVVIVTMEASSATVEVMDVQGKLIQTTQIKSGDQIDLSTYERGVYTLRIKTDLGSSIERIVKN